MIGSKFPHSQSISPSYSVPIVSKKEFYESFEVKSTVEVGPEVLYFLGVTVYPL